MSGFIVWPENVPEMQTFGAAQAQFVGSLFAYAQASRYLVIFTSTLWCAFGVVFLSIALIQPESGWLFKLPQWTLLLPVGLLGLLGVVKPSLQLSTKSGSN